MDKTEEKTKEEEKEKNSYFSMKSVIERVQTPPEEEDLIEGAVLAIDKSSVYVDLSPFGTGIIYGKEFINAKDIIKKINIGDSVKAKVVERENEDGYIELSLKEAKQALIWNEAEKAIGDRTSFDVTIKEANKGGLMLDWNGIEGFLPVSQLKSDNYPRVEDGDKDKILKELKKMVGTKISASIISSNPKEGKLIFSEKEIDSEEIKEIAGKYQVGDELECEVVGAVDFGLFVKLEEGLEGLVHISEIDWGLIEDPKNVYKPGVKVKAKVIDIKDGKISLSIKALKDNPWVKAENKYKKGEIVKGVVIKFNKHGALISIEEGVAGLVHNSSLGGPEKLKSKLELGKTYDFQITYFEPKKEKMTLVFIDKEEIEKS